MIGHYTKIVLATGAEHAGVVDQSANGRAKSHGDEGLPESASLLTDGIASRVAAPVESRLSIPPVGSGDNWLKIPRRSLSDSQSLSQALWSRVEAVVKDFVGDDSYTTRFFCRPAVTCLSPRHATVKHHLA